MSAAMVMAAMATGCAVGEAGAGEIDMDEAEAVEVEETSQALAGDVSARSCGGGGWGGYSGAPPGYGAWASHPWSGSWGSPWNSGCKPFSPCGGFGRPGGSFFPPQFGYGHPGFNPGCGGGYRPF